MFNKKIFLLTLGLILSTNFLQTTLTATAVSPVITAQRRQFAPRRRSLLRFKVPNVRGSRNLEAGAARGQCSPQGISAVVPAKPDSMKAREIPVELTLNNRPTFFVNVPETTAETALFLLRNEAGDEILLEKQLNLTASKGVISYTLPTDFAGLEVGQKYRWRLTLLCDPTGGDRSGDPVASGWIERVEPNAEIGEQLESATDKQRVLIYADNGYWHDTLKTLANLRAENPSDITLISDWKELLQSVGLENLTNQPLIQLQEMESKEPQE
ncbi:DUF928 domain-containing protein [Nodularia sp. UHCC 0506]|uniref:DUF928 domain-containing protein n=1 Tax=Nodularia sp. UHCC 0506 TaxID=3110243 RepID=UPI002B1E9091|nr:DUF928 domain-containing protein [Nodularia sp. UHCC 0506]MEA5515370.1 DUF928 domain-containing protein [Nodularia sp. UHCC 0506]